MPAHDYVRYFPFSKIRKEQAKAIEFAIDAYESGKRFVILELGTGVGKSAIGITIARYLDAHAPPLRDQNGDLMTGSYVITTQKILQEQYLRDFGGTKDKTPLLRSIKSSSNYQCSFYSDQSCAESRRILSKLAKHLSGSEFQKQCKTQCPYGLEKQEFIDSPVSVTNFSYFLAETMYAGKLEPRSLLVVDEAHNTESELGKFIEVTFSEKFARDVLKCKMPKNFDQMSIYDWIKKTYSKAANKYMKDLEKSLAKLSGDIEGYGTFSKQYEMLDKHVCKINRFTEVYNPDNWILNIVYPPPDNKKAGKKFEFKPIDVSPYSHDVFFKNGGRVLLMSATIVNNDIFCESLGINKKDAAYLNIQSPFPVENRPIHFIPVGSMSKNNIDNTLPAMAEAVRMLLEKHSKDKGIIHCSNYKVAKYINEALGSPRLLMHDSTNRDQMLKFHLESKDPTVLLSPSMMEGVDLFDDNSRFQIICKVPFPYLGDLVVKKRMEKNQFWYPYMTAKSVIQSLGRSIRNENDHAESYILDGDWERFYKMNRNMFPSDFVVT
jgi:Rad3-related DNA helicase